MENLILAIMLEAAYWDWYDGKISRAELVEMVKRGDR